MKKKRKQYVIDRKFQYGMSIKAVVFPLITVLFIAAVLFYYADKNNEHIAESNRHILAVIETQDGIFSLIPEKLRFSDSPEVISKIKPFMQNVKELKKVREKSVEITKNSRIVFYFLIIMTVAQTAMIFIMSIFFTHKISGPIYVMRQYLRQIKEGKTPKFRPLRDKDEFKDFYQELQDAVEHLTCTYKK